MSMINLEICQAIYNGNIKNIQHDEEMKNGNVAFLGAKLKDDVFEVEVPLTANFDSKKMVLIYADETMADERKSIEEFVIDADTPAPAYILTEGDQVLFDNTLITGTAVAGQFLVIQNNSLILKANASVVGKAYFRVVDVNKTIGYESNPATRAIVEFA